MNEMNVTPQTLKRAAAAAAEQQAADLEFVV